MQTYEEFIKASWKTVYARYVEEHFNHPTEEEMYDFIQDLYKAYKINLECQNDNEPCHPYGSYRGEN